MKIIYKSVRIERQFSSKYRKSWRYPKEVQTKLVAAENVILSADSLLDIFEYRPFHLEKLQGDRKNQPTHGVSPGVCDGLTAPSVSNRPG